MVSRSYPNILDLTGGFPLHSQKGLHRTLSQSGTVKAQQEDDSIHVVPFETPPSIIQERLVVVAHFLPIIASKNLDDLTWSFSWDNSALLFQMKDGFQKDLDVMYVGCLNVNIDVCEQETISMSLLKNFKCVPVFLPLDVKDRFYLDFCKQQLWPFFHYMLPLVPDHGGRFDRSLWQAYVTANKLFAEQVMEVVCPEDDLVWIHDYHLMVVPTFLRNKFNNVKIGFFLHSPFPSPEIFRTLPVREEILRGLLNVDQIGFHTFDYARHFLSCCSRMLGLEYESKRGHIGVDYYGRTVWVKIMPVGVHMGQWACGLELPETLSRIMELKKKFQGKIVLLGVDDMDIFKGINLKLLGLEQLLRRYPNHVGKVVLVQIMNPARGRGKETREAQTEVEACAGRINAEFGYEGYLPVVLIEERHVPLHERIAYYNIAECCVVTAVRDGMNLIPYEYTVCRHGTPKLNDMLGMSNNRSMLIISEFLGCSPSLSGAVRVNPWNTESVSDAMNSVIEMSAQEKYMRHEKHYNYISTHGVDYWAQSCVSDLKNSCVEHSKWLSYGLGFGLNFRLVVLDSHFQKLILNDQIITAYRKATRRAILLDYDGTMISPTSEDKRPSQEILTTLSNLCEDPKNIVFIVSGRGKDPLNDWFSPCVKLGIAAEHGYYIRWNKDSGWEKTVSGVDLNWKDVVLPVMKLFTESTDGSSIEEKNSALVWHYQDSDPDFGSWQAKELLDHLDSVLANEPVMVKSGQHIIEVKPQGFSKGGVVEHVLSSLAERKTPADFVLCIGDDRSDEDMFESIEITMSLQSQAQASEVFACTVGRKPSKAKYFLDDTGEVVRLLAGLGSMSMNGISSSA